jgi:hypothetical protein
MREIRTSGSVEGPGRVISLVYSTESVEKDSEFRWPKQINYFIKKVI